VLNGQGKRVSRGNGKESGVMGEKKIAQITFEYQISPNYSNYTIAGAHGGLQPGGLITANIFSERTAIPKRITHRLTEQGGLGEIIEEDKKEAIIRDVLFSLSMTPNTARSLGKWLVEKADEYERHFVKVAVQEESDG
jgi:hypothetical protein